MNKDYEQRVINLLKKADDQEGTPEGDSFRAKAMELIAKYNFDAATIRDKSQGKSEIIFKVFSPKGHHIKSQIMLYAALAQCHSSMVIQLGGTNDIKVYGTADAIQQIEWLYGIIWPSALSQTLATRPPWSNPSRGDVTVYRRSFLLGYISKVRDRLKAANKVAEEESHGGGLVLMDDFKRAQAKLKEDHPKVRNAKTSRQINEDALGRGSMAGSRSDIGQARVQNTRRSIGA